MNKVAISNNKITTATITPATMPIVMEEESTSSLLPFLPELARVDLCEKMIGKDNKAASKREQHEERNAGNQHFPFILPKVTKLF